MTTICGTNLSQGHTPFVRNNKLKSNAQLNVMGWVVDSLLENNTVENADVGATIADAARNIVLRKNVFHKVDKPYDYNSHSVVINPMEELESAMYEAANLMGWESPEDMPAEWQAIKKKAAHVNSTPEDVSTLWEKVVKSFAKFNLGTVVPNRIIEALMGVEIQTPNWRTADSIIRAGGSGSSQLMLRVPDSRFKSCLKLSVKPGDLPTDEWSFTIPQLNLEPGKSIDINATLSKPAGKAQMLRVPLQGELSGDGWKVRFTTTIANRWNAISLDKFKISKPLDNPLGRQSKLGYIKYQSIPKAAKEQLSDAPTEKGRFVFASLYSDASNAGKVLYGITILNAKIAGSVRFQFNRNCLFFVNGNITGTTLGRGQWGFASLDAGENKIEMLMLPSKRDGWKFGIPRITWVENTMMIEQ
ncbi:MAG: hypothetical protein PF904_06420 [Kiritimatiellae bacterium]|nr:hypothetical protein [Kiritimatiellia bacterium]